MESKQSRKTEKEQQVEVDMREEGRQRDDGTEEAAEWKDKGRGCRKLSGGQSEQHSETEGT